MSKRYTAFKQLACHSDMWENQNEKFVVFILNSNLNKFPINKYFQN